MARGREFQTVGAETAKLREPKHVRTRGTNNSLESDERKVRDVVVCQFTFRPPTKFSSIQHRISRSRCTHKFIFSRHIRCHTTEQNSRSSRHFYMPILKCSLIEFYIGCPPVHLRDTRSKCIAKSPRGVDTCCLPSDT